MSIPKQDERTPGPWNYAKSKFMYERSSPEFSIWANGLRIARVQAAGASAEANAAFIVQACNAYGSTDALRSALVEARRMCWTAVRLGIDDPAFDPDKHALIQQIDAALSGSVEKDTD